MQTLNFTVTINAPVAKVRSTMLDHPTYEQRTAVFTEWTEHEWWTYEWSRNQGSEIKFLDGQWSGMLAKIATNRLHDYVSIQHLGMIGENNTITMFEWSSFENYTFTQIDETTTKVDVEMTAMPDERVPMFNDTRPKALVLLKDLCEE